ncbi:procathepsin L-like [Physella acuta]|uniref:procathepsin L-like n=1 Tax=Physella acuta TaxID=109671 RepID=UPI0027DDD76F|nr:procathepsin L-like [Physella acuta]
MLKLAVILALIAAVTSCQLDVQWAKFKATYKKNYKDPQEEFMRRQIWETNLDRIQQHNDAYEKGEYSYYIGVNEYADMSDEEFSKTMNGYRHSDSNTHSSLVHVAGNLKDLPDEVDWRTKGYVTDVKDQGVCGSCWSFASTGALEGQNFKKTGKLTSLSEQNLIDCSQKQGNMGCSGGYMTNAYEYIKENHGIDSEASYPYEGAEGVCRFKSANVGANVTGYVEVKSKDELALQDALANVGPVSVAVHASAKFRMYSGGVFYDRLCSPDLVDHAVLAVGYGSYQGEEFWLVKNSWGESWGMKGYVMMARNKNNNCGIATVASYPTV